MKLLIVESPAKARKIQGFLGKEYRVTACMGHFRDLPLKKLGVDLDTMEAEYIIHKEDVAGRVLKDSQGAEEILLCPDPDREGEAIAWHLDQILPKDLPRRRASFQEITKKAVLAALAKGGPLDLDLVRAQHARRILDRLVGYKISPELWRAFPGGPRGLSAGRVQSVAVRLVVEREREIRAFSEEVYWRIISHHDKEGLAWRAELKRDLSAGKGPLPRLKDPAAVDALLERLRSAAPFRVAGVRREEQLRRPQPPFTTPDMQAKAANVLKMAAGTSMSLAQKLYEAGHITYHRTDSVAVSAEALAAVREHIRTTWPPEYLPAEPHRYASKASAQEAHECIRPTHVEVETPEGLSAEMLDLYRLIRNQFISCQMSAGRDALTVITLAAGELELEARGRVELFDGWRACNRTEMEEKSRKQEAEEEAEKQALPAVAEGEAVALVKLEKKECKTKPPPRYSEASLIKKLEREGIGRPSTYAAILGTIRTRGYVDLLRRLYHAQPLGEQVNDHLVSRFPRILDVGFTRECEDRLDEIGGGKLDCTVFLKSFWAELRAQLAAAGKAAPAERPAPAATGPASRPAASPRKQAAPTPLPATPPPPLPCPACARPCSWQESPKWPDRFFHCCHACRCYLETRTDGSPMPGRDWLRPGGTRA